MAMIEVKNLSFTYPAAEKAALRDVSFSIARAEFCVLCGKSGCGKSTLLRQLKKNLIPYGEISGSAQYHGEEIAELPDRINASEIGFVQQNPDNQLVTDKVWHELAFGLESLGLDNQSIHRRVAEMASFFDIQTWFRKNVSELSGGQKQLLNLASVMAMQPKVLILDEPTSQLDPIAAGEFLKVVYRINRELGTTVIISEHRLEELFPMADKVLVMDEGKLIACDTPWQIGNFLAGDAAHARHPMFYGLPAVMKLYAHCRSAGLPVCLRDGKEIAPLTIRDGRLWLEQIFGEPELQPVNKAEERQRSRIEKRAQKEESKQSAEQIISVKDVCFRYSRESGDVLRDLSFTVRPGEFFCLLGGNGVGKSTTLKVLSGMVQPQSGSVIIDGLKVKKDSLKQLFTGRLAMLPQNPQALFVKSTVRADLLEILPKSERKSERLAQVVSLCKLAELLDRHPYDLSGGEQQRAALAKILLLNPDILLLDEPTKGLDAEFKQVFGQILRTLQASGVAILMVSHDIEFCAKYADRCALVFDGSIVTEAEPRTFFSGNSFYTTAANRIARDVLPDAVTPEDVIAACGGAVELEAALPEYQRIPPAPEKETRTVKKLPVWRKILAAVSGAASLVLIAQAIGVTDLTKLIDANGMTALAGGQLKLYGILLAALLVFALSIGRKAERPDYLIQTPVEKRKLQKRTVTATLLILLLIPLTLFVGVYYFGGKRYYFISLLILLECMLPFFLIFEGRRPQARELVLIAVLVALNVAGRAAFFMLPEFKPVVAMTILAGVAFGGETGFLVGAMTMLVSNMLFSQGPWTPWQMFAMGIIGWLA